MKSLTQLLAGLTDKSISHFVNADIMISGLSQDSRQLQSGDLFCAYQGHQFDGKQFIAAAIAKGAAAIVVDQAIGANYDVPVIVVTNLSQQLSTIGSRFYDQPSEKLTVIGVTGTNGKSSVCNFLLQSLQYLGHKTFLMSSVGNGFFNHLSGSDRTTTDALTMQKRLAEAVTKGASHAVLEVSSHALIQGRVRDIAFDYAVFTNLSHDHLDYHVDMSHYREAKKRLFSDPSLQAAIINVDDPCGLQWLAELDGDLPICAYGIDSVHAFVKAYAVKVDGDGLDCDIHSLWGNQHLHSTLQGAFNVENLLAVIATLGTMRYDFSKVIAAVSQVRALLGRMQKVAVGENKPLIIIDYAHTPDALSAVLSTLKRQCRGRLFCVFGCGGNRDRSKRPLMAKVVEQQADNIFICDDNCRDEPSSQIIAEIVSGFSSQASYAIEPDRAKAITMALQQATAEDIVLLAGKGHEQYQEIAGIRHPFHEQAIVQDYYQCAEN